MNVLLIAGMVLAGGTIAFDHLVRPLPQWAAITLYSAAVILFLAGMIRSRKAG